MKLVFETQHRENYGAHAWDGEGVCPQGWKYKGGDTYVIEGVTVAQAQDTEFWDRIRNAICSADDYFEEYIVGEDLVDDVDYKNNHESWDQPYVCADAETMTFYKVESESYFAEPVEKVRNIKAMENGKLAPQGVEYMIAGKWVSYKEGCDAVAAFREAQEVA